MPKPVQLSEHVHYLPGGVNAAIIATAQNDAILVDTGQDKNYGRAIRKACEQLNLRPIAIINTHAHADHYGGNHYLLGQFDVPVYAPPFEAAIMQNPYLEPVYLFHGAKPPVELLSKWLLSKPSRVDHVVDACSLTLGGMDLELLDTSGHAHRQLSVLVDGVFIAADALFGASVFEKYPLPFGQDIAKQVDTAKSLSGLEPEVVLPGHGEPSADITTLVEENLLAFQRAADAVLNACQGQGSEDILLAVCKALSIDITDLARYYLNLCVITAYLSYLRAEGKVELRLKDNRPIWLKIS